MLGDLDHLPAAGVNRPGNSETLQQTTVRLAIANAAVNTLPVGFGAGH